MFASASPEKVIERSGDGFRTMVIFAQEVTDVIVPQRGAVVFEGRHREICDAFTTGRKNPSARQASA
ncbi:hypothetical protein [Streptosporangium sp. 'caverna']|uniref:hypothetical protein n=1 Tax=Streptosporangium sp. 'caverna' TaxID=2202249 RepID=UPI0013A68CD9|nr:hypothetical protein [Streptosporangium sp. 'caverna']